MHTFYYKHVVDNCGGTVEATLYLSRWYIISEEGRVCYRLAGYPTMLQALTELQMDPEVDPSRYTLDPEELGFTAEMWVCTGQQYVVYYQQQEED